MFKRWLDSWFGSPQWRVAADIFYRGQCVGTEITYYMSYEGYFNRAHEEHAKHQIFRQFLLNREKHEFDLKYIRVTLTSVTYAGKAPWSQS